MTGFGAATSVYLALYLITWVVHFFLVAGVLGGAFYAAISIWRGRGGLADDVGAALPLFLGLAITAGVAPLLFVQVLYQHAFYTANLLLYVRFLAVVPALLACFYLFYFARTERARAMPSRQRGLLMLVAALLALFVGVSWVELHTLSVKPSAWIDMYAAGEHSNMGGPVALRAMVFFSMTAALTGVFAIGLARFHRRDSVEATALAPVASLASVATLAFAGLYARTLSAESIAALTRGAVGVHLVVFAVAGVASAALWATLAARRQVSTASRRAIYAISLSWLWSLAVLREALRADSLDLASLAADHRRAFDTGGQIAFVVFAILNVAAIGWCCRLIWRVWRDARAPR